MKLISKISSLIICSLLFSACGSKIKQTNKIEFSNFDQETEDITPYVDEFSTAKINISQTYNLSQEFKVGYKTFSPDALGTVEIKARSIKEIPIAGKRQPENGKKLILVEISVKGSKGNRGSPSTFNQVGDQPSPQFVLVDKTNNRNFVEETYYSDGYTEDKKLFELSKITLDHDQWVHTAVVFQIDQNLTPDLAFRFTGPDGKIEFYDIREK